MLTGTAMLKACETKQDYDLGGNYGMGGYTCVVPPTKDTDPLPLAPTWSQVLLPLKLDSKCALMRM